MRLATAGRGTAIVLAQKKRLSQKRTDKIKFCLLKPPGSGRLLALLQQGESRDGGPFGMRCFAELNLVLIFFDTAS